MNIVVSIIIVNYRTADLTIDCVHSIIEKTDAARLGGSYEIIVVDNDSGDDSVQKLKDSLGESIHLICSDTNLGFGKANNLGASHARGTYLFLLNPDTVLINDAVCILIEAMRQAPGIGVAGGNLYADADLHPVPSYCESFDSLKQERKEASWFHILTGKVGDKLGIPRAGHTFNDSGRNKDVAYIFGADMMLTRKLFTEAGGFDRDFFMYAEEEELQHRITKMGWRICSIPEAQIIHLEGVSIKKRNAFSEKQFRMRMESRFLFYDKVYGPGAADAFYRLRKKRYERLLFLQRIQGRPAAGMNLVMKGILEEAYEEYSRRGK